MDTNARCSSALRGFLALPVLLVACVDAGADLDTGPTPRPSPLEPVLVDPWGHPVFPKEQPGEPPEETTTSTLVWSGRARLEPFAGTFFGANLDLQHDTMAAFDERLGHDAADYVQFVGFPMDDWEEQVMSWFLAQVAQHQGIAIATFEPSIPLWDITQEMAEDLADYLASYNDLYDLGILVRFAHEMNGSWYSWGQQPTEYTRVYRMIAEAIHRKAPRTGMLWAPSYPGGYPFPDGPYVAYPSDPDFPLLDTDGDGVLTMEDDAYLPYYPGDAYVDWVGLSLYHWGSRHPWGDNELPEDHKFVDQIMGTYDGPAGDESGLADFYATFTELHGKPMAIVETAALYNPGRGGPSEFDIKQAWWNQVFSDEVFDRFPRLRMINWFEWDKHESEIGGERIDWTVTLDDANREAFTADLPVERLVFGPIPIYEP
jgi:hypothetical protein